MPRAPIPTWFFALVIVRQGDRFLLVQERQNGEWYLPAGRVEPGETLPDGARRETLEESGVPVILEGILRIEHTPHTGGARLRVVFLARPADDTPPKSVPDEETLQAAWVALDEIGRLPLRGREVEAICRAVAAGAPVAPLSLLGREGELNSWR
jgi:8-oxo-dGTP pyrophosphatase MutT (NUDIX family)